MIRYHQVWLVLSLKYVRGSETSNSFYPVWGFVIFNLHSHHSLLTPSFFCFFPYAFSLSLLRSQVHADLPLFRSSSTPRIWSKKLKTFPDVPYNMYMYTPTRLCTNSLLNSCLLITFSWNLFLTKTLLLWGLSSFFIPFAEIFLSSPPSDLCSNITSLRAYLKLYISPPVSILSFCFCP